MVSILNYNNPLSHKIKLEIANALKVPFEDIVEHCIQCRIDFSAPLTPQINALIEKGRGIANQPVYCLMVLPALSWVAVPVCDTLNPNGIIALMRVEEGVNQWKLYEIVSQNLHKGN